MGRSEKDWGLPVHAVDLVEAELAKGSVLGRDLLEVLREDAKTLVVLLITVVGLAMGLLELSESVGDEKGLGLLGEGVGSGGEGKDGDGELHDVRRGGG